MIFSKVQVFLIIFTIFRKLFKWWLTIICVSLTAGEIKTTRIKSEKCINNCDLKCILIITVVIRLQI